jgi:type II secretory pathway component PulC
MLEPDSANSIAIIKDSGSSLLNIYRIGNSIAGYQVVKIMRGTVLLLKEGKTICLDFPAGSVGEPILVVSEEERVIDRLAMAKKIPDLNEARKKILPMPCIESGKIIGIKIAKIMDKELEKESGIKEGDIITSINDLKLDSLQKAVLVYDSVRHQRKVIVQIKRGKEIKNLVYYLN